MDTQPLRNKVDAVRQQVAGTPEETTVCAYLDIVDMALDVAADSPSSALIKEIRCAMKDALAHIGTYDENPLDRLRDR